MTAPGQARQDRQDRQLTLLQSLLGKKVILSTTDFHYAVGRFVALGPDGKLRVQVNDREILVRRDAVARIREADRAIAEYIK